METFGSKELEIQTVTDLGPNSSRSYGNATYSEPNILLPDCRHIGNLKSKCYTWNYVEVSGSKFWSQLWNAGRCKKLINHYVCSNQHSVQNWGCSTKPHHLHHAHPNTAMKCQSNIFLRMDCFFFAEVGFSDRRTQDFIAKKLVTLTPGQSLSSRSWKLDCTLSSMWQTLTEFIWGREKPWPWDI